MAMHSAPLTPDGKGEELSTLSPAVARELLRALRSIRYGSIELVIHDGRVVQLECREKVRIGLEFRPESK